MGGYWHLFLGIFKNSFLVWTKKRPILTMRGICLPHLYLYCFSFSRHSVPSPPPQFLTSLSNSQVGINGQWACLAIMGTFSGPSSSNSPLLLQTTPGLSRPPSLWVGIADLALLTVSPHPWRLEIECEMVSTDVSLDFSITSNRPSPR